MRNVIVQCFFIAIAGCAILVNTARAGGQITNPSDGDLQAGQPLSPEGTIDVSHQEQGDTFEVSVHFNKPNNGGSENHDDLTEVGYVNWSIDEPIDIPGGDFVGGTWHVVLVIDGSIAHVTGGNILSPE